MTLVGLDLDSSRVRAAQGPAGGLTAPLILDGNSSQMPLALSFEGRQIEVGSAGAAICRKMPHLACHDFLPDVGGERVWKAGRHRVDASRALGAVIDQLTPTMNKAQAAAFSLPTYFTPAQRAILNQLTTRAKWRVVGTVAAPIAIARAAYEQLPWSGLALVGHVDSHAFTWSAVAVRDEHVTLLDSQSVPSLGRAAWLRTLLEGVARRCVRLSRRDPRESADAEQGLYDQLLRRLTVDAENSRLELAIQTSQWFQNLMLDADELRTWCAPLVARTLAALDDLRELMAEHGPVMAVLLSDGAGRLPGVVHQLEDLYEKNTVALRRPDSNSDFGANLLFDENAGATNANVHVVEADALARVAHEVATRVKSGTLATGHHDSLPLPAHAGATDLGPARLQFRGQEHLLSGPVFSLGRDPDCDLIFDSELYPTVSTRHCDVVLDRRAYLLRDRSRHGTLVNDTKVSQQTALRPGDWIRLGPGGPVVRFLGQPGEVRPRMTTA